MKKDIDAIDNKLKGFFFGVLVSFFTYVLAAIFVFNKPYITELRTLANYKCIYFGTKLLGDTIHDRSSSNADSLKKYSAISDYLRDHQTVYSVNSELYKH